MSAQRPRFSRGGKGKELMQRGGFTRVVPNEVPVPLIEGASS